jgi:cell division protein FtsL
MNAAAKVLHQHHIAIKPLSWSRLAVTPYQWSMHVFLLLVLLSSLVTIIVTSNTRHDYRQLQSYQQQRSEAELERGRLLLEESTLLSHARVIQMAGSQSAMEMPSQKMLVVMTE